MARGWPLAEGQPFPANYPAHAIDGIHHEYHRILQDDGERRWAIRLYRHPMRAIRRYGGVARAAQFVGNDDVETTRLG